jgi:hypothetical protein
VIDAAIDQPLAPGRVFTGSAAYFDWRHANSDFTGNTAYVQSGLLLADRWQPVLRWEHQSPETGRMLDSYHIGLNFYLKGNNANLKADWVFGDRRDALGVHKYAFRMQLQILL